MMIMMMVMMIWAISEHGSALWLSMDIIMYYFNIVNCYRTIRGLFSQYFELYHALRASAFPVIIVCCG
jgi:hypothetical protein